MGTDVHLLAEGVDIGALVEAEAEVRRLEARWSRFLPDSELSRLNASAGRPVLLPDDTFGLVVAAVEAWRLTGGRFDPTVLAALRESGYDRSFELVPADDPRPVTARPAPGCDAIRLDDALASVTLPRGVGLDLGGIAKGHTADLVADALVARGATAAVSNVGGDLRAHGDTTVAVDDPFHPGRDLARVRVVDGAVATTSRARRCWRRGGRPWHHLLDPRTGLPADTGVVSVTVVAATALWAEVVAKALFVAGPDEAADVLAPTGASALLVLDDRTTRSLGRLQEYVW